jgi:hypothetical protein
VAVRKTYEQAEPMLHTTSYFDHCTMSSLRVAWTIIGFPLGLIYGRAHRWLGRGDELREFEMQPVRWTLIESTIPMTTQVGRKNAPLAVLEEVGGVGFVKVVPVKFEVEGLFEENGANQCFAGLALYLCLSVSGTGDAR